MACIFKLIALVKGKQNYATFFKKEITFFSSSDNHFLPFCSTSLIILNKTVFTTQLKDLQFEHFLVSVVDFLCHITLINV